MLLAIKIAVEKFLLLDNVTIFVIKTRHSGHITLLKTRILHYNGDGDQNKFIKFYTEELQKKV